MSKYYKKIKHTGDVKMNIINKIKAFFSGSTKPLNLQDCIYKYVEHEVEPKRNIIAKFYFNIYSKDGKYIKKDFVLIIFSSDHEVDLNRKLFKKSPHLKKALDLRTFDEIVEQAKKVSTYEDILILKGYKDA
jgi:hypothetical protein